MTKEEFDDGFENPDGAFVIEHWRIELKVDRDSESELNPDEGLVGAVGDETSVGGVWETTPTYLSRTMALHALQDLTPGEFMDWALNTEEGYGSYSYARSGLIWFLKEGSPLVDIAASSYSLTLSLVG